MYQLAKFRKKNVPLSTCAPIISANYVENWKHWIMLKHKGSPDVNLSMCIWPKKAEIDCRTLNISTRTEYKNTETIARKLADVPHPSYLQTKVICLSLG